MKFLNRFLSLVFFAVLPIAVFGQNFDHSQWDSLLQKHILVVNEGVATQVDYDGFLADRVILRQYLNSLASLTRSDFEELTKDAQLAFLINTYNAWTIDLVLTEYPDLKSIKDLGSLFKPPWRKKIVQLFGEHWSLDNIEHDFVRGSGKYNDPRIHFAVNCASIGCPALRNEAYSAEKIQTQLEEATSNFLKDSSRNRLKNGELQVSSIFKWYQEDFEKGWQGIDSLNEFFSEYSTALGLSNAEKSQLLREEIDIEFLDYDWILNKINN